MKFSTTPIIGCKEPDPDVMRLLRNDSTGEPVVPIDGDELFYDQDSRRHILRRSGVVIGEVSDATLARGNT